LDFDLTLLVPFIKENFTPDSFKETYVVNRLIVTLDREKKATNKTYLELKPIFDTQEYRDYKKLDWNRFRDKEEYEFDNWREYEEIKSADLKENFIFDSIEEFNGFLVNVDNFQSIKVNIRAQIESSLEVIMSENFVRNNDLGLNFLEAYLNKNYDIRCLHRTVSTIVNHSEKDALKLWGLLEDLTSEDSIYWKLSFLDRLPDKYVNNDYIEKLVKTIKLIDKYAYLYIKEYLKYSQLGRNTIKEVIEIVCDKIKNESLNIRLSEYPYKEGLDIFEEDYKLIKESYFQQFEIAKSSISFDYKLEGFANIYKTYREFLLDFFNYFYSDQKIYGNNENLKLPFIWDYPDRLDEIEKVIKFLINRDFYISLGGHSVSILFNDLNEIQLNTAFLFMKSIIKKNQRDSKIIEILFDTIRTNLQTKHNELFQYFLSLNNDVEFFRKIDWVGNAGVQSGNVIWGELYAKRWEKVLNVLNASQEQLRYIPIKNFLKKLIQSHYNRAEDERMRNFIRPDKR